MNCIECGVEVPPRVKARCGNPPGFCSVECRLRRKRTTYQQWLETNRNRKLARDAECRARRKATHPDYFREHYAKHREKRKREANEWYHANSERALQHQREYWAKNPELRRKLGRRHQNTRLAIKKRVFVEVVDPTTVFARDQGTCGICRKPVEMNSNWEIDHIIPMSKGGPHSYANVQLAHRRCNRSKGAKLGGT